MTNKPRQQTAQGYYGKWIKQRGGGGGFGSPDWSACKVMPQTWPRFSARGDVEANDAGFLISHSAHSPVWISEDGMRLIDVAVFRKAMALSLGGEQ